MNFMLQEALKYQRQGLSIIPLKPRSKEPLINWKEFQTRKPTEQEVIKWFSANQHCNIGILTGSINTLVVVDMDGSDGLTFGKQHNVSSNIEVLSGKGKQVYYKWNEGIRNSASKIALHVDIRGEGGYVLAPPSIHPNGKRYEFINAPLDVALLQYFPMELLHTISNKVMKDVKAQEAWIAKDLESMTDGNIDTTLFRVCASLRVKGYSKEDALVLLKPHAERVGATNGHLEEKINNVWTRYESQRSTRRLSLDGEGYRQRPSPKVYSPGVEEDWQRYCERRERESSFQEPELPTGFSNLDKILGGLRRGEVYTIGARTGVGKTCFCINISRSILGNNKRVLFLSTEMSYESIWERLRQSFGNDGLSNDDFKKFDWFVSDAGNLTESEVRQMISEVKPDVLILDHIQHLGSTITNRAQELGLFIKSLKNMAREHDIAIIVASQLNRGAESINLKTGERIKPQIYHLAECGGIENESAVVILLSKEYQIDDDHDMYNLNLAKNRYGVTGQFNIVFDRKTTRMYEQ